MQKSEQENNCVILLSTNKAKLDEGKRTTLLNRLLVRLGTIEKHLNVRKYKKKAYTLEESVYTRADR